MKLVFTILFILTISLCNATNYYIDNSGSDGNAGTSAGTAWQTITKINSFGGFSSGDSILFNRNGTWNGKLLPPNSNLNFGAYGTGNKPIITGLQSVTGFTLDSTNIYKATFGNSVPNQNTVLINGVISAKGRGNTLSFESSTLTSITSTNLTGTDFTGGEVVTRGREWIIDHSTISSQSGTTINFYPAMTYGATGNAFFIQNMKKVLDVNGEWAWDSLNKILYVRATSTPTNVQASSSDTLVYINKNGITLSNINFIGANKIAICLDSTRNISITNCTSNYNNFFIYGQKAKLTTIQYDSIQNSLTGAILLTGNSVTLSESDSCTIDNNYIRNIGMLVGMGNNGNDTYMGLRIIGKKLTITNNKFSNIGYIPIYFAGQFSLVEHNKIDSAVLVKNDGGGIQTFTSGLLPANYDSGTVINANIITNCLSYAPVGYRIAPGIYLDNKSNWLTVSNNFIKNCFEQGIFLHEVDYITLTGNTVIGTYPPLYADQYVVTHSTIKNNIFYSQDSTQPVIRSYTISGTTIEDSNFLLRPLKETSLLKVVSTSYSLPAWVTATTWDVHSSLMPLGVTTALPLIYTNPTLSPIVQPLTGLYYDGKGNSYNNSITIQPYGSTVLFKSTSEVPIVHNNTRIGNLIIN